jgi:UDP-N-acetylmuramate--alanine ligase
MAEKGRYHLVGAAGVGMSSVAQALAFEGHVVSGSDRYFDQGQDVDSIPKLMAGGIRFVKQDGRGVTADTTGVVVSTAIEDDNPDIRAARALGVPVIHRAEMLARLMQDRSAVAVTGTCGKSTVTGMMGWILEQAGKDPVVVNGAPVLNWVTPDRIGNARAGKSGLWVFEADESDRSLMCYHPDWAVITNASKDHFDMAATLDLFRRFAGQVRQGTLSAVDHPGFFTDMRITPEAGGSRFVVDGTPFFLPLPGVHNAENAVLAALMCRTLGVALDRAAAALRQFKGIQRRLERVGEARGIVVMDDYAHNPAKIEASWQSLAPHAPRIFGIWRPHGYGPLSAMMNELVETFQRVCRASDRLFILPVYDAGGTANRGVCADDLVGRLQARIHCRHAENADALIATLVAEALPGDVVVTMGARDPGLPLLARRILAALDSRA